MIHENEKPENLFTTPPPEDNSLSDDVVMLSVSSHPEEPQQESTVSSSTIPHVSPNVFGALRNTTSNDEMKSFIRMLPNFESVFPDALLIHLMHRSGVTNPSAASARCLGIAAQKFVSDIINDALVLSDLNEDAKGGMPNRQSFVLTQDLIKEVLSHRGIFVDSFH